MQSPEIVLAALVVILVGAATLYYQFTGTRRFESLIAFCGVALIAGGIAMAQDGVAGSRKILWMFPSDATSVASQPGGQFVATATAPRTAVIPE